MLPAYNFFQWPPPRGTVGVSGHWDPVQTGSAGVCCGEVSRVHGGGGQVRQGGGTLQKLFGPAVTASYPDASGLAIGPFRTGAHACRESIAAMRPCHGHEAMSRHTHTRRAPPYGERRGRPRGMGQWENGKWAEWALG